MPTHDETLREKLRDILEPAKDTSKAIREATRYWRYVYTLEVPNADNRLVPGSFMDRLDGNAARLDDLVDALSKRI
jgi:hypothetical protein